MDARAMRPQLAACAALAAAVAACWLRTAPYPFVYDDVMHVADNPHIRSLAHPMRFFLDPATVAVTPTPATEIYRPLATLSHAITYALLGPGPRGFRLVNIALHASNAVLLFLLLQALFPAGGGRGAFPSAALLGSLAWAVHPVNVESVTWIVGRSSLLCALFLLISFHAHLRAGRGDAGAPGWRAGALAAFCLALLSKENAIVLPLLLAACDPALLPRPAAPGKAGRGYGAYWKVAAAYLVLRLAIVGRMTQRGSWGGSLAAHLAFQIMGLGTYLRLLALPLRLRLDYVFDAPPAGGGTRLLACGAAAAIFFALALLCLKRRSAYAAGLLWIFLALLPVLNLLPIKAVANERFLYIPAMGLSLLAVRWLAPGEGRRGGARLAGTAAAIVCLGLLAARRNEAWRSAYALWGDSARKEPRSFIAQVNLGKACEDGGRHEEAIAAASAALATTPTCEEARAAAYHIRALGLMRTGRAGEAEADLRRALELDGAPYLRATLAQLLSREGRAGEAGEALRGQEGGAAPVRAKP